MLSWVSSGIEMNECVAKEGLEKDVRAFFTFTFTYYLSVVVIIGRCDSMRTNRLFSLLFSDSHNGFKTEATRSTQHLH